MSVSDLTAIIVGLVSLYLQRQQNQIFRRQNDIFSAQAGAGTSTMESNKPSTLERYWPMLAMTALTILTWGALGYDYYERHTRPITELSPGLLPWAIVCTLALTVAYLTYERRAIPPKPVRVPVAVSLPVILQIMECVIARRPTQASTMMDIFILLRVRVRSSKPDVHVRFWNLELNHGEKPYSISYLSQIPPLTGYRITVLDPPTVPPPALIQIDERLDEITAREALPMNVDKQGWLMFRVPHRKAEHVLGADFKLTVNDQNDNTFTETKRPGEWINLGEMA
jgi:hypothetical protein